MVSPGLNETDRVFYTVLPAQTFSGDFDAWFNLSVSRFAPALGQASQYSILSRQNGVLLKTAVILSSTGIKVRAYFLGYAVDEKVEMLLILVAQTISDRDPRLVAALTHAKQLADRKFFFPAKPVASGAADVSTMRGGDMGPGNGFGKGLSGAYFGTGRRWALTLGSGLQGMNDVRVIVVLPDGTWREGLPDRGLETDIAADRRDFDRWGIWTTSGGVVRAKTQNDEVVLDAQNWRKLSPIDGLRTDGVFVKEDSGWAGAGEPELVLHADGAFDDRSGLSNMVGSTGEFDGVPKHLTREQETLVLRPGGGTYEFRNFTLVLRFSDGRVRRMSVYAPPNDDVKRPKRLVLGGTVLVRK